MEKFKKVIEDSNVRYEKEDGGQALICYFGDSPNCDDEFGVAIRLHSYDDRNKKGHIEAERLRGKRVRITIEEL